MPSTNRAVLWTLIVLAAGFLAVMVWARTAPTPRGLGLRDGRLAPCPDSPNCVSTEAADPAHAMEPIPYDGPPARARERLLAVIRATPRTRIARNDPDYLHVEFRTPVIGFIDDVEFRFDHRAGLIRFRSASRLGHSDLGVNRKRMEAVRTRYEAAS